MQLNLVLRPSAGVGRSDPGKQELNILVAKAIWACSVTGRNRLSAEPWLGGDNRLGILNLWGGAAWLSGLVASLALLSEWVLSKLPRVLRLA